MVDDSCKVRRFLETVPLVGKRFTSPVAIMPACMRVPQRKEGTWYYNSFGMNVDEGATVTFAGDVVASDVSNAFTAFYNRGSME